MNENQSLKKLKRSELEDQINVLVDSVNEYKIHFLREKKKNSLLEKVIFEDNKNEIVNRFFEDLRLKETSSIRIIFLESDYFLQKISYASGKYCEDFALLDNQIIEQISGKNNLIIQDTSRIHNIRFSQGYTYPRSLVAFVLQENNIKIGIAWIGDINYQAFSKLEFEHFEKIIDTYQGALAALLKKEILKQERQTLQLIVNEDEYPTIIFNSDQKISYANKLAIDVFGLIKNEQNQNLTSEVDFSTIFEFNDSLEKLTLQFNGKTFEVFELKKFEKLNVSAIGFRFYDKTWEFAKNKYFSTIISTITHFMKSPLVEIKGLTALTTALGNLSEKQLGFLTQINNRVNDIENNIVQLLSVDRIQKDGFVQLSKFSIDDCLQNVIDILTPFAKQKQIMIISNIDKKRAFVTSDQVLLKNALLNILDYAIKETHIGGTIEINHLISAERYSIAISDSGKGISKLDVKKMMEGKNLHPDRDELEITKDIILILKGDLLIESDLGSGTTITLQFPRIV